MDFEVNFQCFSNAIGIVAFDGNAIDESATTCEATAGVEEFLLNQINIAPNPVSEIATLTIPQEISNAQIRIFYLNGKKLFEQHISEENTAIDFSSLKTGMYFYQIYSENELILTKKFLAE